MRKVVEEENKKKRRDTTLFESATSHFLERVNGLLTRPNGRYQNTEEGSEIGLQALRGIARSKAPSIVKKKKGAIANVHGHGISTMVAASIKIRL